MTVTEAELTAALIAHETLAERGPQGEKGDPGPQGEKGETGPRGPEGPRGTTGPQGERGPTGADGPLGQVGPRGETGPQGAEGVAGRDGRVGTDGRNGLDGAPGPAGERGPQGVAGQTGAQGERGPEGPAGRSSGGGGTPFRGIQIVSDDIPPPVFAQSFEIGDGLTVEMYAPGAARLSAVGGGADANYVHDQSIAASTWTVTHGLGKRPSVMVVTSAGDVVEGDIHYVDNNVIQLAFGAPFAGAAYLN